MESLLIHEDEIKGTDSNKWILKNESCSVAGYPKKLKPLISVKKDPEEIYDMIKILSHDIRSPLVMIGASIKLLPLYKTPDHLL